MAHSFSIITPSLNSANVIAACLQSVAKQGVQAEHIVVDGQSGDSTLEIIRGSGTRVTVISEPPHGIYAAINRGIQACNGDIVGTLHSDDCYASAGVLARVAAAFDDPQTACCYGDLCYVDAADPAKVVRYWRAGAYRQESFLRGWMPPHPTFFVRRRIYEQLGLYRTDLGTAADYELMMRYLLKHEIHSVYIPEVLVHMRTGGASNASLAARIRANRMDRQAWRVNGLRPYPWTTLAKPLRKLGQWWSRP